MIVSSQSKVEHVVEQVARYNEAAHTIYSSEHLILILLASESPKKWQEKIITQLNSLGINNALYCRNLGLITIVDDGPFNRALFTEDGTQFYRIVSDLINIRREERTIAVF